MLGVGLSDTAAAQTYSWVTGIWGVCSATCGGGTQTRTVVCQDPSGTTVANTYCAGSPQPASTQSCYTTPCLVYNWQTGSWGACSAPCGGGTQARTVECHADGTGALVDASLCDPTSKPISVQTCNSAACPTYYWLFGSRRRRTDRTQDR